MGSKKSAQSMGSRANCSALEPGKRDQFDECSSAGATAAARVVGAAAEQQQRSSAEAARAQAAVKEAAMGEERTKEREEFRRLLALLDRESELQRTAIEEGAEGRRAYKTSVPSAPAGGAAAPLGKRPREQLHVCRDEPRMQPA